MMRRSGALIAAVAVISVGTTPAPAAEAAADKTWCMTYCDVIHKGCTKTFGLWDADACEEWKAGCLDGCRVNG